jgi:hypothetical protein
MNASNKLCVELLPTYTDFAPLDEESFTGYKLAEQKGGPNYYSVVTGMFRYKARNVGNHSYASLYKRDGGKHYNKEVINSVGVFLNPRDAKLALAKYLEFVDHNPNIVVLEITLKKNLRTATYSNQFIDNLPMVFGDMMDRIKKV